MIQIQQSLPLPVLFSAERTPRCLEFVPSCEHFIPLWFSFGNLVPKQFSKWIAQGFKSKAPHRKRSNTPIRVTCWSLAPSCPESAHRPRLQSSPHHSSLQALAPKLRGCRHPNAQWAQYYPAVIKQNSRRPPSCQYRLLIVTIWSWRVFTPYPQYWLLAAL